MIDAKITMMGSDSENNVHGRVVLDGQEWVVQPFKVYEGTSAKDKENRLIERAIWVAYYE